MTGADALLDALTHGGVRAIFTVPGVQLDALFDALARRDGAFRVWHTRHEQATSYMADGYTRVSGEPSCCLVVPGPGLLNATAGLATAYARNTPILCVAGQIPSATIGAELGQLHELRDQTAALRAVVKWSTTVMRPGELGPAVAEALRRMRTGRPRPVAVEVPPDVLEAARAPADRPASEASDPSDPWTPDPDPGDLDRAAALLTEAQRPLVLAGGGVLVAGAWDELRELAERVGAPVVMTADGKGALDARHPLACEPTLGPRLTPTADVVLAVGTRLGLPMGRRLPFGPGQKLVRIDADAAELRREVSPAIAIHADARAALAQLAARLPRTSRTPNWPDLTRLREDAAARVLALKPQAHYGEAIRRAVPEDGIVVAGMTQIGYWCRLGFPVWRPRTFLTPGYQGTLGFELPTGLGAQLAAPDTPVVVLAGDGGFLFNVQELATAVLHDIPVVSVVFNDGAYGNVRRTQRERFDGRYIASELHNPDFPALAESFGVRGVRAVGPDALERALGAAIEARRPTVIEVPVGPMPDPWAMLTMKQEQVSR